MLAELERVGPEAFNKAEIARQFEGRGAGRSSIYRWIDGVLKSGKAGQHVARKVKEAVQKRAERRPDAPAEEAAKAAVAALPAVVRVEDIAGNGGTIQVVELLNKAIQSVEGVLKAAHTEDGKPRNGKMILSAVEVLRRCLDTSVTLYEAMRSVNDYDRFHAMILEEVAKESPETAERIVMRLRQVATNWGG